MLVNPQTIVYVLHCLFFAFMAGVVFWVLRDLNPRDDHLIEDFLYLERRKRVMDRRAKRRSPESNGRRKEDQ